MPLTVRMAPGLICTSPLACWLTLARSALRCLRLPLSTSLSTPKLRSNLQFILPNHSSSNDRALRSISSKVGTLECFPTHDQPPFRWLTGEVLVLPLVFSLEWQCSWKYFARNGKVAP